MRRDEFAKRWKAAESWMLVILPGASNALAAGTGAAGRPEAVGAGESCEQRIGAGVKAAQANDFDAAERALTAALACPGPAASRELAGVRLLQRRWPEVSELASRLAAQPAVRRRLAEIQRALGERGPLVAEGRDLGTVVYPDAAVKIYLDADLDARARRRARELEHRGIAVPLEDVRAELARRDERDRSRADSPLVVPDGALVVNTSGLTIEEQVEAVLRAVRAHPRFPATTGAGPAPGAPEARSRPDRGAG